MARRRVGQEQFAIMGSQSRGGTSLQPQAQDLLAPVSPHADRHVHRLVAHQAFVTDRDPQRAEENQRGRIG